MCVRVRVLESKRGRERESEREREREREKIKRAWDRRGHYISAACFENVVTFANREFKL